MVSDKPTPFFRWMALCKTTGRRNYAYHLCHQHVFQINNGETAISAHWYLPFLFFIWWHMNFFYSIGFAPLFQVLLLIYLFLVQFDVAFWFDLVRLTKMIISDGTYLLRWKIKLDEWVGTTFPIVISLSINTRWAFTGKSHRWKCIPPN